ncbi:LysE family transporter [Marinomonas sp. 5E14-1]|uniref:LysE family translocator n=1 Tax=Marinomonas sp. 5E14-1 TaxID=3153922 RepID=UPI003263CE92
MSFLLLFLGTAIPLTWSPGPNNIMCALLGTKQGIKPSLLFILGLNLPIFAYAILVGVGVSTFMRLIPDLMPYTSILGAIYIVYLGATLMMKREDAAAALDSFSFKSALFISALNFKTIAVLMSLVTTFGSGSYDDIIKVSVLFPCICIVGHLLWLGAGRMLLISGSSSKYRLLQNRIFGFVLVLSGLLMLL